jgi:mono/diheme cytochrome c family protein
LKGGRKRVVATYVLACLLSASAAFAWPWSKDLRRQVSVKTQEMPLAAPAGAVPRQGVEKIPDDPASDRLTNPVPSSPESIKRGQASFMTYCVACHGPTATGNGLVAQKGFFPMDLHSEHTRTASDGFIYSHIRRGGPLMPSYRFALSSEQAWDVVNYVRSLQRSGTR